MSLEYRDEIWVVVLIVLASIGFIIALALWMYTLFKIISMEIKTRNLWLSQVSLFFIFLAYGTCFIFVPTPNTASCAAIRFLPGVCYCGLFAGLLLKSMNIISESRNIYVPTYFQTILFIALVIVQVVIGSQWLILVPPDTMVIDSADGSIVTEILLCSSSLEEIILSLVYQMLLIFALCIMTTVARRTTIVHREEAFLLSVCVGFVVPVWICWTILGSIGSRRHNFEDACLAFGLLATCSVILILIYLPRARHLSKLSRSIQHVKFEKNNPKIAKTYALNTNPSMGSTNFGGNLSRSALHQSTTSLHSISQFAPGKSVIVAPVARTDEKRYSGFIQKSQRLSESRVYLGPQTSRQILNQPVYISRDISSAWTDDGTHL